MIKVGEYIFARPYPDMDTKAEPSKLRLAKVVYIDRKRYRFYNIKFEYGQGRSFVESRWFTNEELIEGFKAGEYQLSELRQREVGLLPPLIVPWEEGIEKRRKKEKFIFDDVDLYNEFGDFYDGERDIPYLGDELRVEEQREIRDMIRQAEELDIRNGGEYLDSSGELYYFPEELLMEEEDDLSMLDMDAIMRGIEAQEIEEDFDDSEQWDPSMDMPDDYSDIEGLESDAESIEKILGKSQSGKRAVFFDIYEDVDELDMQMSPSLSIPENGVESINISDDELYDDEEAWDDSMEPDVNDSMFLDDMSNEDMLALLRGSSAPAPVPEEPDPMQEEHEANILADYDIPAKVPEDEEAEYVREMTEEELCRFFNVRPEDLPKAKLVEFELPVVEDVEGEEADEQEEQAKAEDEFIREMTEEEIRQLIFDGKPKESPEPEG